MTYLTFAKVFHPYGIEIINYYADTAEWHPATWLLSAEQRKLVKSEIERIKKYREKGDLLKKRLMQQSKAPYRVNNKYLTEKNASWKLA